MGRRGSGVGEGVVWGFDHRLKGLSKERERGRNRKSINNPRANKQSRSKMRIKRLVDIRLYYMARKRLKLEVYLKELAGGYVAHRHATMAAAIAFRGLFSAIPFVVVFAAAYELVQTIWQLEVTPWQVSGLDLGFLVEAAKSETAMLASLGSKPAVWFFGLVLLVYGASTVFRELTLALELIWETKGKSHLKEEFFRKLMAVALVFGLAGALILAVFGNWFLDAIAALLAQSGTSTGLMVMGMSRSLMPILTFGLLLFIYKFIPRVSLSWHQVWLGALLATVLFWVGQMIMGWFLGYVDLSTTYGAAGSLVMFLLWCYYTSLIVLLGAEWVRVQKKIGGKM